MSNITERQVLDTIAERDSRFVRHTERGYVLAWEGDDEVARDVEMTPEEFAEACNVDHVERLYTLVDLAISAVSHTSVTSSEMVDVMLDIRRLLDGEVAARRDLRRRWHTEFSKRLAYELRYGSLEVENSTL